MKSSARNFEKGRDRVSVCVRERERPSPVACKEKRYLTLKTRERESHTVK